MSDSTLHIGPDKDSPMSGGGGRKASIPMEVLKSATKCTSGCSCLSGSPGNCVERAHRCEVDYVLGKNMIFVKPKDGKAELCPYMMHYGNGHLCQCPVRYYLYSTRPRP